MTKLLVTYRDGYDEHFYYVTNLNRFNGINGILSFTYVLKGAVRSITINCRIRMDEVRKYEVWEDDVD